MPNIESVTYNYTLAAAGIAEDFGTMPADPDMSKTKVSAPFLKFMGEVGDEAGLSSLYTVRVAVLDTGIDATHEDLANRVVTGYDAINDEVISKGVNSDVGADGHGTKAAGRVWRWARRCGRARHKGRRSYRSRGRQRLGIQRHGRQVPGGTDPCART